MLFTISHSTQLELKSDLLPVFLFFIYKFGILFQEQKYCYHHLEKSPENYTNSLPVSVLYSFRRSYLGQHAASINAKTKCYSVFVELHSDSFHSETRLPSLLTLTLALLCTLMDGVVFPVLPGVFGLFEHVYKKVRLRVIDMQVCSPKNFKKKKTALRITNAAVRAPSLF